MESKKEEKNHKSFGAETKMLEDKDDKKGFICSTTTTSSSSSEPTVRTKRIPTSARHPHAIFPEYLDDEDQGRQCFYDPKSQDFEKVSTILQQNLETIREELSKITKTDFIKWPETLCQSGWTVFGLYAFGREIEENTIRCPKTTQLLKQITSEHGYEITTAGFSSLDHESHIVPHKGYEGYSDFVVRLHMGLVIPKKKEFCGIRVGNEKKSWGLGEILIFDDLLMHEAWNFSGENRIILLIDLKYNKKSYLKQKETPDCIGANFSNGLKGLLTNIDTTGSPVANPKPHTS